MVHFLVGENDFALQHALRKLIAEFEVDPERFDGIDLVKEQMSDLLWGTTLFAARRLIVIKNLSENKSLWMEFSEWLERIDDNIVTVVLIETKPDKRSRTFKALQKHASMQEFPLWTSRDYAKAREWLMQEAKQRGVRLKTSHIEQLIEHVGVNQSRLAAALEKLALADEITPKLIEQSVEPYLEENIFGLLETALRRDTAELSRKIATLRLTEDAYRTFGLLSLQLLQLSALVYGKKSSSETAHEISAAPFVLARLSHFAKKISISQAKEYIEQASNTDIAMKRTAVDPWLLVEQLLQKIARS